MMNFRESLNSRAASVTKPFVGLAFAVLLSFSIPANTQNAPAQDSDITRAELAGVNQFLEGHPELAEQVRKDPTLLNNEEFVEANPALQQYLQQHPETREEIKENPSAFMKLEQRYDRGEDAREQHWQMSTTNDFLETHPEIAEQLRKNPALVNNEEFVQSHPALQQYLQQHSEIREEWKQNPTAFMNQEERFDRREDAHALKWRLATTDQFLDSHPEIAEQVRKDPSLLNNRKFVESHQALDQFLQQHPEIRDEMRENPNAFMQQEQRFDRHEDDARPERVGSVAGADRFLDKHPEIAEQLQKDPSLLNNRKFVDSHPALQEYLQRHPELRAQAQQNPSAFMQQQQEYERQEDSSTRASMMQPKATEPGAMQRGMASSTGNFGEFLGAHSNIAQQLSQDPSLLNNPDYLKQHPDLQQYLRAHPEAQRQFNQNPSAFMGSFASATSGSAGAPASKPKP